MFCICSLNQIYKSISTTVSSLGLKDNHKSLFKKKILREVELGGNNQKINVNYDDMVGMQVHNCGMMMTTL